MVIGAGWAGARAMTSTSGPGISLMTEFAGFAYFAEIPGVDLGHPAHGAEHRPAHAHLAGRRAQGLLPRPRRQRHVILLPANMEECFESGWRAFDLAERLQTPVFVLSDLDLGMNLWMSEPFAYPDQPMDRGKVLERREDLNELGGFARYGDDGRRRHRLAHAARHGVIRLAAYFTRGTGHNAQAQYSERPDDWEANLERLERKHDYARTLVPSAGRRRGARRRDRHHRLRLDRRADGRGARHAGSARRQDELPAAARPAARPRTARASSRSIRASTSSRTTSTARWRRFCMTEAPKLAGQAHTYRAHATACR